MLRIAASYLLCCVSALAFTMTCWGSGLRTVALVNDVSPGGPPNSRFALLGTNFGGADPSINGSGQVAFPGAMSQFWGGVTSSNDAGVWSEGGGSLHLAAREGNHAPGTAAGDVFNSFDNALLINDLGQVAFTGYLLVGNGDVTNSNNSGIWTEGTGTLGLVAREGTQAPGTAAGTVFADFTNSLINLEFNDVGQTAFTGLLATGTGGATSDNDSGVWAERGGTLNLIAREGFPAPGTPAGAVYDTFAAEGSPSLNNSGLVVFRGFLRAGTAGVTSDNRAGIWSDAGGSLSLVARQNDSAPGTPVGAAFSGFGEPPKINSAGHLLFRGFLVQGPGGVTANSDDGLWSNRNGALALVMREGDQAPGTAVGTKFGAASEYAMNDRDQITFLASLQIGTGDAVSGSSGGLWSERSGTLTLVARPGTQAPGTAAGTLFDTLGGFSLINAAGQVAFYGTLRAGTGDVTTANDSGIWAQDSDGTLKLIVREGDSITVKPGDTRTITSLRFLSASGNADGHRSQLADNGDLVFWANMSTGGDGLFVSTLVEAPQVPADYNHNGIVDAADYTLWLDTLGSTTDLRANGDNTGSSANKIDQADYTFWKQHFGLTSSTGMAAATNVPEPPAAWLLLGGVFLSMQLTVRIARRN